IASARDNSDWDVWLSKVDLRLQCGMPCSKLEVSTVQHGTLSGAGYLHQSLRRQGVDLRNLRRTNEPLIVPDLPDESGAASSNGVRTGTSRRATREPLNHRA